MPQENPEPSTRDRDHDLSWMRKRAKRIGPLFLDLLVRKTGGRAERILEYYGAKPEIQTLGTKPIPQRGD